MDPLTSSEVTVTEVPRKSGKAPNAGLTASSSGLRRGDGDRYEILSELATGGMATVYVGRLRGPHGFSRLVAVKAMHPQLAKDRIFHDMFLDEARLSARIRHPNVVPTIDVVSERGHLLLVMEYVEGESLASLAKLHKEKGGFPPAIACAIAHDMLAGLHGAHETTGEDGEALGLIHRDVSPQNILVGVDGLARVLDFGVAKAAGRVHVTQTGEVKGKIPYMPPEQLAGEELDRTVDVYSAGIVLWEMLTGRRLFEGPNEVSISLKVRCDDVPAPSSIVPGIPAALDELVLKAISRDRTKRFATAQEMGAKLEEVAKLAGRHAVAQFLKDTASARLAERASMIHALETGRPSQAPGRDLEAVLSLATAPATPEFVGVATKREVNGNNRSFVIGALSLACLAAALAFATVRGAREQAVPRSAGSIEGQGATEVRVPPAGIPAATTPNAGTLAAPPTVPAEQPPKAAPLPAPAADRPVSPKAAAAPKGIPVAPARSTAPASDGPCRLPYTVDADGHRHYKAECL